MGKFHKKFNFRQKAFFSTPNVSHPYMIEECFCAILIIITANMCAASLSSHRVWLLFDWILRGSRSVMKRQLILCHFGWLVVIKHRTVRSGSETRLTLSQNRRGDVPFVYRIHKWFDPEPRITLIIINTSHEMRPMKMIVLANSLITANWESVEESLSRPNVAQLPGQWPTNAVFYELVRSGLWRWLWAV